MVEILEEGAKGGGGGAGGGFLASVGAKVIGIVVLAIAVGGLIWWYRLSPEQQTAYWQATKSTALWFAFMLALPWGLFFLPGLVIRANSNWPALLLLVGYQVVDLVALLALWGWTVGSAAAWVLLLIGMALAAGYNYVIAESLARQAAR